MPFDYYDSLSAANQRIYRKSDAITAVRLPEPESHAEAVAELRRALVTEKPKTVQREAQRLCTGLAEALGVAPFGVKVLSRRPNRYGGELHGLYEREEGKRALITVWMRTAAHKRVVAFRTFLRTLLHEVCHHLDFELYELPETFHTEGFFKRESSLVRALAPVPEKPARRPTKGRPSRDRIARPRGKGARTRAVRPPEEPSEKPRRKSDRRAAKAAPPEQQLSLFPDDD